MLHYIHGSFLWIVLTHLNINFIIVHYVLLVATEQVSDHPYGIIRKMCLHSNFYILSFARDIRINDNISLNN